MNSNRNLLRTDCAFIAITITQPWCLAADTEVTRPNPGTKIKGRAIAEAVSSWLPTAAARIRARVWQVGFVVENVASRQDFSIIKLARVSYQRPCDELITRPRSPDDCPRSSNRNETESFMETAQHWAVEPQGKNHGVTFQRLQRPSSMKPWYFK
jgi:hypothetical protein